MGILDRCPIHTPPCPPACLPLYKYDSASRYFQPIFLFLLLLPFSFLFSLPSYNYSLPLLLISLLAFPSPNFFNRSNRSICLILAHHVVRGAFPLLSSFRQRENHTGVLTCFLISSGIFGYINYLVERDRQFIIDTLLNGMSPTTMLLSLKSGEPLLI